MANGCFDVLHIGHLRLLRYARELGTHLLVAINSDESVRRLKGPTRPINPVNHRVEMLRAMRFVDQVVVYDENTAHRVIESFRPKIIVWGGESTKDNAPELPLIHSLGIQVVRYTMVPSVSTTEVVRRLNG